MNEYMQGQPQMTGDQGGMSNAAVEELKKKVGAGNVIRGIGVGVITVCGIVSIAMQARNTQSMEKGMSDLNKKMDSIEDQVSDIREDVYDIMEQGCPNNTSSNPSVWYDPGMTTDKPNIYVYPDEPGEEKPVIYLYGDEPLQETHVSLTLHQSDMLYMWPQGTQTDKTFDWDVLAAQDGTLYDQEGNEYSYIFWEASEYGAQITDEGFCVKGSETAEFLRDTLKEIGLTPKEYNEFIVYWMPRMQDNAYNIIRFEGLDPEDVYNQNCELTVTDSEGNPADSMLRVMMVWEAADEYTELKPQEFETFERDGFTVVEWGGTEIK